MRKVLKLIILLSMLLMTTSFAAIGHIDGCTNTGDPSECCTKTFNITAQAGYRIVDVLVNGVSKGPITSYTFSDITEAQKMEVKTEKIQYTLTVTQVANGTISPDTTVVDQGANQVFTITPAKGYKISSVVVDNVSVGAVSSYTFSNVTANHTITASYVSDPTYVELPELEDVEIGAYISYAPSVESIKIYESESGIGDSENGIEDYQEFNPSMSLSWRVMSNNEGQLDIISAESVGKLNLNVAYDGYYNAVYILDKLGSAYANPEYATKGRGLGSTSNSVKVVSGTVSNKSPYTDTEYTTDVNQLVNNNLLSGENIWLASRYATGDSYDQRGVRYINSSGTVVNSRYTWDDNNYGVRPIVSLTSAIEIVGGKGTATDPYRIR